MPNDSRNVFRRARSRISRLFNRNSTRDPYQLVSQTSSASLNVSENISARALGYRSLATSSTSQVTPLETELSGLEPLMRRSHEVAPIIGGRVHVFPCALLQTKKLMTGTLYLTGEFALLLLRPRAYSQVRVRIDWRQVISIQAKPMLGQREENGGGGIRVVTALKVLNICNLTEPVQARRLMTSLWQAELKRNLLPVHLDDPEVWQVQRTKQKPATTPIPPVIADARLACGCLAHLEDELISTVVPVAPIGLARMMILMEEANNELSTVNPHLPTLIATGPWHPDPQDGKPCRSMIHQLPSFFSHASATVQPHRVTASCLVKVEHETADHVVLLMMGRSPEMLYGRDFQLQLRWCFSRPKKMDINTRLSISMRIVPSKPTIPLNLIRRRAATACIRWFETLIVTTKAKLRIVDRKEGTKVDSTFSHGDIIMQMYLFMLRPLTKSMLKLIHRHLLAFGIVFLLVSLLKRSSQPALSFPSGNL